MCERLGGVRERLGVREAGEVRGWECERLGMWLTAYSTRTMTCT